MPTPLLLPSMTHQMNNLEGYTSKVLAAAAGPYFVLDAAPAVIVLDKPGSGNGVQQFGTIAAILDISQDSTQKFSLQGGPVLSVQLLGLARCRVSERDEIVDESGVRSVAVAQALLKVSDELVTGIGRPSFHSPIHDLTACHNYFVRIGRCHDQRRALYASIRSARTRLEMNGVDPGPAGDHAEGSTLTSIRGLLESAISRLEPFYGSGHFTNSETGEIAFYELGSFVALCAVATIASPREIKHAVNEVTAARDRYEDAYQIMILHQFELMKEGKRLNALLEECGEECELAFIEDEDERYS
ncbi:hypothetical protein TrCOL_g3816 [Triparma columacea]|uniref:Uncharacterized protein n=2 Tax=Triparma columacea TaxID=722753 RepID=A0A9W7GFP8_9STRA|nr:hypothetical protein TrCOL_g3816 [Triparma columacea]